MLIANLRPTSWTSFFAFFCTHPARCIAIVALSLTPFNGAAWGQSLETGAGSKPRLAPQDPYVRIDPAGHLQLDGRRKRFWGFIGHIAARGADISGDDPAERRQAKVTARRADVDLMVKRIDDLGFNLVRSWEGTYADPRHVPPVFLTDDYSPGDGSVADTIAYYFWKLDQRGIKIWMSSLNSLGSMTPGDVGIVNDPATADAWKAAMSDVVAHNGGDLPLRSDPGNMLRYFDPRTEALLIARYRQAASWPNKYKNGLRLADDPQIAVWELTNEEFPFRALFGGRWQELPPFFKNELLQKWTNFLKSKYKDDAQLRSAWQTLLPAESLDGGSILLAPLANPITAAAALNDVNPQATQSLRVLAQPFSRADFAQKRGEDVVEFFTSLMIDHKKRYSAAIKTIGKSTAACPCVWDSGNAFQIQSSYMFQQADAVSTCSYVSNMGSDPSDARFPFYSALDSYPRLCWDVPWLEQSSIVGKPMFVYETNIGNRTKYRAEYPLEIASLGSIQDWDIVCWHVYGGGNHAGGPDPFKDAIHDGGDYFEYGGDEVQLSVMRAAGEIFKNISLPPAPHPTIFTFGRKSLYSPESMDYGKSFGDLGQQFIPTAYRYGVRIKIDPTRQDDSVSGPTLRPAIFPPCPVRPNDAIEYDWRRSFLKFDAPATAAYVGFFAQYGSNGITYHASQLRFSDISVVNPVAMPYPVSNDEKYVALTLTSTDGRSLANCSHALLSAVSTSFNYGYRLDPTRASKGRQDAGPDDKPPVEFFGSWVVDQGKEPVLVARVGATVTAPEIAGMTYHFWDWNMHELSHGEIARDGVLKIPASVPIFYTTLDR